MRCTSDQRLEPVVAGLVRVRETLIGTTTGAATMATATMATRATAAATEGYFNYKVVRAFAIMTVVWGSSACWSA